MVVLALLIAVIAVCLLAAACGEDSRPVEHGFHHRNF
jgi:hypothetical protein